MGDIEIRVLRDRHYGVAASATIVCTAGLTRQPRGRREPVPARSRRDDVGERHRAKKWSARLLGSAPSNCDADFPRPCGYLVSRWRWGPRILQPRQPLGDRPNKRHPARAHVDLPRLIPRFIPRLLAVRDLPAFQPRSGNEAWLYVSNAGRRHRAQAAGSGSDVLIAGGDHRPYRRTV